MKFLTGMPTTIITYFPSLSADQKPPQIHKTRIKCSILHFHPDPLSSMAGLSGHHGSLYKFLSRTQHTLCFSLSHRTLISSLSSLRFLCTYLLNLEENNSDQLSMIIKDFNQLCSYFLTSGWFIFRLSNLLAHPYSRVLHMFLLILNISFPGWHATFWDLKQSIRYGILAL